MASEGPKLAVGILSAALILGPLPGLAAASPRMPGVEATAPEPVPTPGTLPLVHFCYPAPYVISCICFDTPVAPDDGYHCYPTTEPLDETLDQVQHDPAGFVDRVLSDTQSTAGHYLASVAGLLQHVQDGVGCDPEARPNCAWR